MVVASKNPTAPSSLPCYSEVPDTAVRPRQVRFVSRSDLDGWVRERRVVLDGPLMTLLSNDGHYVLQDAARILGPRGQRADLFGMTGRIVAISELFALGASVSPGSLHLGLSEYDLQLGFLVYKLDR